MPMWDPIFNNIGHHHIIETIFLNLDYEDILAGHLINQNCNLILNNPNFWLRKWLKRRGLSKKNYMDWMKIFQVTDQIEIKRNLFAYIKKIIKVGHHHADVPCYVDANIITEYPKMSWKQAMIRKKDNMFFRKRNQSPEDEEIASNSKKYAGAIQILAPTIDQKYQC